MDKNIVNKGLNLLFDRLGETLLSPKGDEGAVFQLTEDHLDDQYKSNGLEINNRFGEGTAEVIPLVSLKKQPNISLAKQLPQDAEFSVFIPSHRQMADEVINALLDVPENELPQFLSTCVFAREKLNRQLFFYCYSVALMHRRDTNNIRIPNLAEAFPSKLVDSQVFGQAREIAATSAKGAPRRPIIIPRDYTATDLDIEHRLAYFREDLGVNLHHRYWHLVYPFSGRFEIVNKDRRGELFFYMHSQIIARYNGERLNNALPRVKKFNNWDEPIPEAYYPKLDSLTTSRGWPPRQANMRWQDVNRVPDNLRVSVADMQRWRKNVEEAIATGMVRNRDGSMSPLNINLLGNLIESSILSPNPELYGALHNNGHVLTGYIHDPTSRYLEYFGVMADEATTMRDPFFYRWHGFIDDLFQRYKESANVAPYVRSELENPGVQISSVRVESSTGDVNTLNTFWMQSDVDVSGGLDFSDRGAVYVRFTHLNHRPFRYVIDVNNTGSARRATVRIFMAPKFDERRSPWVFSDQRKMFIEMDRFVVPLNAGQNQIVRMSTQSSVTIPFEQTFRDLSVPRDQSDAVALNYCGCGWPQHMLVPRGTPAGAQYDLFVMLSNYDLDSVDNPDGTTMTCVEASSFCGLKDKKYPDRRDMGFPFDRPSNTAANIQDFILPNMSLTDITIRLKDDGAEVNPRNPQN
ncbi:unnamed protein product, partial [Brenthis ino]